MISQETIAEVKARANLVEIVSESVSLKRQGAHFVGLCPFHGEKTPSFFVKEHDGYYNCFGCGVRGNAITFLMEIRGISFPDAVEELAMRYGIAVRYSDQTPTKRVGDSYKSDLLKINALAQDYFRTALGKSEKQILKYLSQRGLVKKSLDTFGVGFAPNEWSGLVTVFRQHKVDEQLQLKSGLVRRNQQGDLYDLFRGRLMFPIYEDRRRISAFGGRVIPGLFAQDELSRLPKYINSPESEIYQKSKTIYGLPQAMEAIKKQGVVFLVEGYLDVIGLWQSGVENVVATCGTAFTDGHVRRLSRFTHRVIVLFDGDSAGKAAAAKAFKLFLNSGIDAEAVFLDEGDDPDTVARRFADKTDSFLKQAPRVSLLEAYLSKLIQGFGISNPRELGAASKANVAKELGALLATVNNPIEQNELVKNGAFWLGIDEVQLQQVVASGATRALSEVSFADESVVESSLCPISQLPNLDRELLLVVMAGRSVYTQKVLLDAELIEVLKPISLSFIEGLDCILRAAQSSNEVKKEQVKELLSGFGDSWMAFWREANKMVEDPCVDISKTFEQCQILAKKNKLEQIVGEIDRQLGSCHNEGERPELLQKRLGLLRELRSL